VALDEPLAHWTSLRVGGPADALLRVDTRDELVRVSPSVARALPVTILGGGFIALVRDGGLRGVVVRLAGLRETTLEGDELVRASRRQHTQITRFCAEQAHRPRVRGRHSRHRRGLDRDERRHPQPRDERPGDSIELFAPERPEIPSHARDICPATIARPSPAGAVVAADLPHPAREPDETASARQLRSAARRSRWTSRPAARSSRTPRVTSRGG
jgi:hypothetical protein